MTIGSVERALDILELLARKGELRFTDIRAALNIPKGSLHNLLKVLEKRSYIFLEDPGNTYRLSVKVVELSGSYLASLRLGDVVPPALRNAALKSGETCQFAILDGTDVFYLFKEQDASSNVVVGTGQGMRLPAQYTALGKAILSTMDDEEIRELFEGESWTPLTNMSVSSVDELLAQLALTRQRGWSVDDEESSLGIMCLGSPVFDHQGKALGAVSMSFIKRKHSWDKIPDLAVVIQECATEISSRFGHQASLEKTEVERV